MQKPANAMVKVRFLFFPQRVLLHPAGSVSKTLQFIATTTYSTICPTQVEKASGVVDHLKNPAEVLARLGCSESDISKIFVRRPSLRWTNVAHLHSKLSILSNLGVSSPDLVKIISCRPRMLGFGRSEDFEERVKFLMTVFDSREMLVKAIVKNPSLLTYDLRNTIKPAIAAYEEVGVNRKDFVRMLQFWPTIIPRTSFDKEKREYIRRTGVSKESKMYKYVVTLIGISRQDTIRLKVANLENLGLSNEEAFHFFGRFPLALTLSVDKVQRNMTFVLGTLKLPANAVLKNPFLLYLNLETVLKPRVLLVKKMQDMGLNSEIKSPAMMRALKMAEKKFLKAFVECHPEDVAAELMEFYKNAKAVKRLGESSKKHIRKGFPF